MADESNTTIPLTCSVRERSISARCSCSDCDSLDCFTKRRRLNTCSCDGCIKSATCLSDLNQKYIKVGPSDIINEVYLNKSKFVQRSERDPEELFKSDVNFDLERKNIIEANKPPTSLDEYINRLVPETKLKSRANPESLNQYIDVITGNKQSTLKLYIDNLKEAKPPISMENENCHTKNVVDKKAKSSSHCKGTCKKCKRKKKYTQVQSLVLTPQLMNLNPRTAKLSTEIMDLPYRDSSEIIINKSSEQSTNDTNPLKNDIFKYDFFKRLKDVYDACSCKVCECIPTKILKSDICNCKPCECIECKRYMVTSKPPRLLNQFQQLRWTCTKYNRENKNTIPYNRNEPCNYAQCQNNDFLKPCECKPCQCVECKQTSPEIQVFLAETHQNSPCQCLPCNCTECLRETAAATKSLVHEVSTTTSRQSNCQCEMCSNKTCKEGFDSCRCDTKSVIRKPFERVSYDYDIRTATIINDISYNRNAGKEISAYQNIDQLPASCDKDEFLISRDKLTKSYSEEYKCLSYDCQENAINTIKSSRLFPCPDSIPKIHKNTIKSSDYDISSTKCKSRYNTAVKPSDRTILVQKCSCNKCDCRSDCLIANNSFSREPQFSTYRCKHRVEYEINHAAIIGTWPIKKGDVLTPSAHQIKMQKEFMAKFTCSTNSMCNTKSMRECTNVESPLKTANKGNISKENDFCDKSLVKNSECIKPSQNRNAENVATDLLKFRTLEALQYYKSKKKKSAQSNNFMTETAENNVLGPSSSTTLSKTSFCNQRINCPLNSKKIATYTENTYDSSDHDYPTYSISFPNATLQTCLEDVLKSDLDNGLNTFCNLNTFSKESTKMSGMLQPTLKFDNISSRKAASVSSFTSTKKSYYSQDYNYEEKRSKLDYCYEHAPSCYDINHGRPKNTSPLNHIMDYDSAIKFCSNRTNHKLANNITIYKNYGKVNTFADIRDTKYQISKRRKKAGLFNYVITNSNGKYFARDAYDNSYVYTQSNLKLNKNMKDEVSWTEPATFSCTQFDSFVNTLNLDENYARVHKTLKDAQEFYLQLLGLSEMYDKANKDFQSISEKLKISQESIIGEKYINNKDRIAVKANCATKPSRDIPTSLAPLNVKSSSSVESPEIVRKERLKDTTPISEKPGLTNLTKTYLNQESISSWQTEFQKVKEVNVGNDITTVSTSKSQLYSKDTYQDSTVKDFTKPNVNLAICQNNFLLNEFKKDSKNLVKKNEKRKYNLKNYNSNIKKITIVIPKKVCVKKPELNHSTVVEHKGQTKQKPNQVIDKSHPTQTITEGFYKTTSTDKVTHGNYNLVTAFNKDNENISPCPLFETQSNTKANCEENMEIGNMPPLDGEMKDTESMLVQRNSRLQSENNKSSSSNNTLNEFQSDIVNLLKRAILQSNVICEEGLLDDKEIISIPQNDTYEVKTNVRATPKISVLQCSPKEKFNTNTSENKVKSLSSYDNVEDQKVTFLSIRKVTAHSLLVKWNPPRDLSNVQGYQLMVDGRPAQKIITPSRCIAVVSCVPRTGRILVSIRTIITTVSDIKNYPIAKMIYQPRCYKHGLNN